MLLQLKFSVDRASTQRQQSVNRESTERQQSVNRASTERQQSVNHLGCCIVYDSRAVPWHLPIINVLAAFVGKREGNMVTAPVWKWASTERQRFCVLHLVLSKGCAMVFIHNRKIGHYYRYNRQSQCRFTWQSASTECQQSVNSMSRERQQSINLASTERQQSWVLHLEWFKGCATAFTHNQRIGSLCGQKRRRHGHSPNLKMSVNRASTILCGASCIIQGRCYSIYP